MKRKLSQDESGTEEEIQEIKRTHINNRSMVDIISTLPRDIKHSVLSLLPIRVAALSSALSKDWHYEFCMTPTLRLMLDDNTDDMIPFINFVNRIVNLRIPDPSPLREFHLSLHRWININEAELGNDLFRCANAWIDFALAKGVTILTLHFYELPLQYQGLPRKIFVAKSLVKLNIGTTHHATLFPRTVMVHLPNLKTLRLDMLGLGKDGQGFYNLLEGCPAIEELEMKDLAWFKWSACSVSIPTLKILSIWWDYYSPEYERRHRPASVSIITPNLVYLDYNDDTAGEYQALNFASLDEAEIRLHLRVKEHWEEDEDEDEDEVEVAQVPQGPDASVFMEAIRNVKKLLIHSDTLQVLAFSCRVIPTFLNLTELIIESDKLSDWDAVPVLLRNSPQLQTLVFMGLTHQPKNTCGDVCMCEGGGVVSQTSCLKASPVKVLKIHHEFDEATSEMDGFVAVLTHFLVSMAHLQVFVVYCVGNDKTREELLRRIEDIPGKASPMCRNQVVEKKKKAL